MVSARCWFGGVAALFVGLGWAGVARGEEPAQVEEMAVPRVHHAPISTAKAHEDLEIVASIEHPEWVRYAGVVFRSAEGALKAAPMLRGRGNGYVAVIPGDEVKAPGLSYTIEVQRIDGARFAVFASRDDLQPVNVAEDRMDTRERMLFERLGGRRSVVSVRGEYARFGTTTGSRPLPCAPGAAGCGADGFQTPEVEDAFWQMEASYTYRPLRTVAEFGIRLGIVRGSSLVGFPMYDPEQYSVGRNYGSPWVRFRLADIVHLELETLTSITEDGFSVGGGSSVLVGDPYGTRLTLGFEWLGMSSVSYFGSRFFSRLDIAVTEGFEVGPMIEVTDMPHADQFGVRLLGDASIALGRGFRLSLRGGYQARKSTSGGPAAGLGLSMGF